MGELISARADVARIEDHVRRALRAARARGGDVAEAAEARLAPAVTAIDSALALLTPARETEAVAWAAVLAEDAKSDDGIKGVRDAMWNALGRPRQSPYMDHVFPGGVTTYTAGNPTGKPTLMKILLSRLSTVSAPQWSKAQCEGWAAQIETLRQPYELAVETHRPTEAAVTIAEVGYRSAVRDAQARLRAFKRDLLNQGLTEPQTHEIIPDASATTPGTPSKAPNVGGADKGGPEASSGHAGA